MLQRHLLFVCLGDGSHSRAQTGPWFQVADELAQLAGPVVLVQGMGEPFAALR